MYFRAVKFGIFYQRFLEPTITTVDKVIITQQFNRYYLTFVSLKDHATKSSTGLCNIFIKYNLAYSPEFRGLYMLTDYKFKGSSKECHRGSVDKILLN